MAEPDLEPSWSWRAVYAVAVVVVLILFLQSLGAILNPFLLFLLLVLLLSPFAGTRLHLLLLAGTGLLTAIWLLTTLGSLLAPFFLALGFAYILHPLAGKLQARGLSRSLAVTALALPALAAIALVLVFGIPALGRQLAGLINGIPQALQTVTAWALRTQAELARRDFPLLDEGAMLTRLQQLRAETVLAYLQGQQAVIARRAWVAVTGAGRGISFLLTILSYLFLVPILIFYLLRDWDRITGSVAGLVPGVSRARVTAFFQEYDRLLSGYLRGNLMESAIVGLLTWLGLWVLGIPYAFLLGAMAAVFNVIPYLGLVLTLIPALIVALFTEDVLLSMGKVVLVFAAVQALDGAVIGPKVVGESVGLHPVWIILSLSVAGFFWGFVGLLLAIPLAVLVKLLLGAALERYRRTPLFLGADA